MIAAAAVRITNNGAGRLFSRFMNRKIPHARDEHEGYNLGFDEVLIPTAAQQVID